MSNVVAKHSFVSAQPEGSDPNKVRTSNWNADHALSGVGIALDRTVTADWTLSDTKNTLSAGPVTINNGVVVTIPDGGVWVIV